VTVILPLRSAPWFKSGRSSNISGRATSHPSSPVHFVLFRGLDEIFAIVEDDVAVPRHCQASAGRRIAQKYGSPVDGAVIDRLRDPLIRLAVPVCGATNFPLSRLSPSVGHTRRPCSESVRDPPRFAGGDLVTRLARERDPVRAVVELVWNAIDAEADAVGVQLARSDTVKGSTARRAGYFKYCQVDVDRSGGVGGSGGAVMYAVPVTSTPRSFSTS
jgi:hypothetical protein